LFVGYRVTRFLSKFKIKLLQINVLVFLDCFDLLILKINFKKLKKYYYDIFLNKKYFKKQLLQ